MNIEFIAATKLISSSKDQSFGIYKEYVTRAKFMEEPHAGLAKDYAYTALLISLCKGRGESQGIIDNLIKQGELVESDFDDDKKLIMGLIKDSLEAGDSYGSENSNIGKLAEVSMEAPSSKVSRARIWTYFHNWALIELWAA